MTFAKWLSLSEEEREAEKRSWYPFEPGYWHSLAVEATARFNAEFGSKRHVTKVFKSLYRARELIVAVQTDNPAMQVQLRPQAGNQWEVKVTPTGTNSLVKAIVSIRSDYPAEHPVTYSAYARVQ